MVAILFLLILNQSLKQIPYYDPWARRPSTYEEFQINQAAFPFLATLVERSPSLFSPQGLVLVFVNAGLYPSIQQELNTWLADVESSGYSTKVLAIFGGKATNLRSLLQAHRDSGLVGGIMIGDLPVAWWSEGSSGEDYPIDLFFTDLDGLFSDNNGDGKYDSHTGNTAPEIWLGRLYASRLTYDSEERLIKAYLQRNHLYRTGQLPVPRRGLVYNEVAWYPNDHGMSNLYSNVTVFNDENLTTAYHYKNQLRYGYEFVHIVAHSSPWVHTFFLAGDRPGGGSIFNFEIPALSPSASFYFLNACMCARFTERDNLGDWYLFAQPFGLVVIGSTQLMYGINDLSTIYRALSRDSVFGDAFLKWHKGTYSLFRGTLLLGDPTLKVNRTNPLLARFDLPKEEKRGSLIWTEYVIDTTNFVNGNPDIGYSQGQIRIVFDSGRIVRSDNYFTSFDRSGFTRPESIAWHEYYDLFPACATDARGRFWVVWQSFRDYSSLEHFQLFSCYYQNGTWSNVQRVGPSGGHHDVQASLAAGSDNRVWCAFKSWRNGQGDIWVTYEENGGPWTTPVRLTTDSLDQIEPCVIVDQNNRPWVFWTSLSNGRWSIQGRKNNNGWQPIFDLDTIGNNGPPKATVDNQGRIWVIWHKWQNSQFDIYYTFCLDSVWREPEPLTRTPGDEILPDITASLDGSVWATWQSKETGSWNISCARYVNGWLPPEAITSDQANDYNPAIAPDASGNIWITWASDRRDYWNIYAAVSTVTNLASPSQAKSRPISILPNPFRQKVAFFAPGRFSVEIFTVDGRKIAKLDAQDGEIEWTPKGLARGLYLARIITTNQENLFKLVYKE